MENYRDLSPKDQIAFALDRWISIQNVTGHNAVARVAVLSRYRDEPDRGPYTLYEGPAVELRNLLDADRAARIGRRPAEDDPVGQLEYAAARLRHVLRTQQMAWSDELTYPPWAAAVTGALARAVSAVSELTTEVAGSVGGELDAGRVVADSSLFSDPEARRPRVLSERLRDDCQAVTQQLTDAADKLRQWLTILEHLHRTVAYAYRTSSTDGPTLSEQYLLECRPIAETALCHVRLFRPKEAAPVVVLGVPSDVDCINITNAAEQFGRIVAEHLFPWATPSSAIWVEYTAAEARGYSERVSEHQGRVREDSSDILLFEPDFAEVGWRGIPHEELEGLVGGSVRRWHALEYTSAALMEAGARPVSVLTEDGLPASIPLSPPE